ncbi:TNF receptor-associated factor 5 isoform X2 [Hydra vulgaris]|uniref:TNF receptor-associated factor 5 isoform X2 n=1 Tax=Hydra vulgaris TaxID=6087 RepID=UPI001F5F3B3E|nr:TNF receptor-associated factor 5 isoform X2 [Hydra vulgaris]
MSGPFLEDSFCQFFQCSRIDDDSNSSKKTPVKNDENQFGGFDEKFVDPLPDGFVCPICFLALRQPIQTKDCGHRFCLSCFNLLKRNKEDFLCPLDRQIINMEKVFNDKATERVILSLPINCRNFKNKCDWVGSIASIDNHLKHCVFSETLCPNTKCQAELTHKDLPHHLEFYCKFRKIECQYCSAKYPHNNIQMAQHLANNCSLSIQRCEYYKIGCIYKGTKAQRETHIESSMNFHLLLAINKINSLNEIINNKEEKLISLENKFASLKQTELNETFIKTAEEKLNKLESDINNVNNKINLIEKQPMNNRYMWLLNDIDKINSKETKKLKGHSICSSPFYSAPYSYKFFLEIYLNGFGEHKGTHSSIYLNIIKGEYDNLLEWPLTKKIKVSLLDQSANRKHKNFYIDPKKSSPEYFNKPTLQPKRIGCLMPIITFPCPGFIMNNTLMIECEIED